MITLGCCDPAVSDADCAAYLKEVEQVTRLPLAAIQPGNDRLAFLRAQPGAPVTMSIADVQKALKQTGFFPGGQVDGICGYRTQSAIRLFQEYVRSVEKLECLPDGRFGPQSQAHLQRWLQGGLTPAAWAPAISAWRAGAPAPGEYSSWIALLGKVKQQYLAQPSRIARMTDAFGGASDTLKIAQWDVAPTGRIHLVGIRREQFSGKFDDVFVLLVKGLVFKFQGTTEPGATDNPAGPAFLVPGQHAYHFGWHQKSYLALRPVGQGVLVVRAGTDGKLDDSDLVRGLEVNPTINVHWGGRGMARDVGNWSEGCQAITGSVYINAADELVDCSAFAATTPTEASSDPEKTRGAYSVLLDLVTALGSDVPGDAIRYTLLAEADLGLDAALSQRLADDRRRVMALATG